MGFFSSVPLISQILFVCQNLSLYQTNEKKRKSGQKHLPIYYKVRHIWLLFIILHVSRGVYVEKRDILIHFDRVVYVGDTGPNKNVSIVVETEKRLSDIYYVSDAPVDHIGESAYMCLQSGKLVLISTPRLLLYIEKFSMFVTNELDNKVLNRF